MKEYPIGSENQILFKGPMVRAILEGHKTQTRRVITPQPANGWVFEQPPVLGRITSPHPKKGQFGVFIRRGVDTDLPQVDLITCPYGKPGDRLWVRETWAHDGPDLETSRTRFEDALSGGETYGPYYRATESAPGTLRWRPSIHMPRWASRITLEITGVRVERLREISEEDARDEGAEKAFPVQGEKYFMVHEQGTFKAGFEALWTSINGRDSWLINPWVWVVEFRRLKV